LDQRTRATGYQIQIDPTPTFDSANLIDQTLTNTSYTRSFPTSARATGRVRALPGGNWTTAWRFTVAGPLIQLTTDASTDDWSAITGTNDGTLWLAWTSDRSGNDDIWYKTSADDGTTWSAEMQLTSHASSDYLPAITQASDGMLWVVWASSRSGNYDLWYKTSPDGGATWSIETQLTTHTSTDYLPAVIQTSDSKLWVVWTSDRSGNDDIWYKTSSNGGASWSADTQLTTNSDSDASPAIAQSADGAIWIVWAVDRSPYDTPFYYVKSADNGLTWMPEAALPITQYNVSYPRLILGTDSRLWLAWSNFYWPNGHVWYATSGDNGSSWSAPEQFTRFVGKNIYPGLAALPGGKAGVAWTSDRSGNDDIWFGIPASGRISTRRLTRCGASINQLPTPTATIRSPSALAPWMRAA